MGIRVLEFAFPIVEQPTSPNATLFPIGMGTFIYVSIVICWFNMTLSGHNRSQEEGHGS
jgi:hypothetical protein